MLNQSRKRIRPFFYGAGKSSACCWLRAAGQKRPIRRRIQIDAAVAATIFSIPTYTPYPVPTHCPHPDEVRVSRFILLNTASASATPTTTWFNRRKVPRINPWLPAPSPMACSLAITRPWFMQVIWKISDPNFDPQTAMKQILEESQTFAGQPGCLIDRRYERLLPTDDHRYDRPTLRGGGCLAMRWRVTLSGRFTPLRMAWPRLLLKQSLERFRCDG